jgi:hypothetical protein
MNAISDALIITKRQLLQLARVPELILFSIIQPIMVAQSIQVNRVDMCSY